MDEDATRRRPAFSRAFRLTVAALSCAVIIAAWHRFGWEIGAGPVALTSLTFGETLADGIHVVVFLAEWCGPCAIQEPVVEEFAQHRSGRIGVGKVDVDAEPALARAHRIEGIPTLIIFRDGVEMERLVGVTDRERLALAVDKYLYARREREL